MSLSDVAIKRPVFTSMMALCLIVLGIMGLSRLGQFNCLGRELAAALALLVTEC